MIEKYTIFPISSTSIASLSLRPYLMLAIYGFLMHMCKFNHDKGHNIFCNINAEVTVTLIFLESPSDAISNSLQHSN